MTPRLLASLAAAVFALALVPLGPARAQATQPAAKHALIVLTNHADLGDTGRATGFYLSEAAHPWHVFKRAGFEVSLASPMGGDAPIDPTSLDRTDPVNAAFLDEYASGNAVPTRPLNDVDPASIDAIFFAGGHGTMFDFPQCPAVKAKTAAVYERGGVVGAVCHGPAALVDVTLADGSHLVDGKRVAAFTNAEERAVELTDAMPFLLQTTLQERGAEFVPAPNFEANVVVDERLVTGQNPASAEGAAEAIVVLLNVSPD
ncbi:MAG: type 1 glutamine amidotransferase domain-containing protein [Planctomycetota bacterium]